VKADLRLSFGGKSRQFKKQDEGLTDWLTIMEKVLTIMRVAIPLIGHPIAMLAYNFHECLMSGTTCDVTGALFHSFALHMWPMMLLFSFFGAVSWGILGFVLKRLRENRLRLDTLHQEFEFQVATLRHHYKNLAIGIHGFSGRIKRKITNLDETFSQCLLEQLPTFFPLSEVL
jgi:hypothetical protein